MPAVREAAINPGTFLASPEPERIAPAPQTNLSVNPTSFFYSTAKTSNMGTEAPNSRPRSGGSNLPPKKSSKAGVKDSKHGRFPSSSYPQNVVSAKSKKENSTARSRPNGQASSATRPTPKLQRSTQQSALKQHPPLPKKTGKGEGAPKKKADKVSRRKDQSLQGATVLEKKWCRTNIDGRSMRSESSGD